MCKSHINFKLSEYPELILICISLNRYIYSATNCLQNRFLYPHTYTHQLPENIILTLMYSCPSAIATKYFIIHQLFKQQPNDCRI